MRTHNNRIKGIAQGQRSPASHQDVEINGIGAEVAFCKLLNIYPDMSIHTRSASNGTDTGDAVLPNGFRVDIKTTKYKSGKLLVLPWQKGNVDFYVLMIGEFPNYEFKGAIPSCLVTKKGDMGYGESFVVTQNELTDLQIG